MALTLEVCSEVLAKSARTCCVCRVFKPLHVQVHHIREKADGGSDDFDNLIPVCIECHASIHTKTKMTQNFSEKELKKIRDDVYELVRVGQLPKSGSIDKKEIELISSILAETNKLNREVGDEALSTEAIELLSTILCEGEPATFSKTTEDSILIDIGGQYIFKKFNGKAQYPDFVIELLVNGLINTTGSLIEITEEGKQLISNLIQTTATYTQKKVKCFECGLHFIICTWNKDTHNSSTIHCPECGQNNGHFLVWSQQKFGFIFQDVPGNANVYEVGRLN
ncbi:HNH endonuclease [Bacillus velezensis]|uniref:HNH endonuclease n=1 Tax=Bacillus velezensis TaxID=492670 RepID=UPI00255C0818|nr:HNH endonuclease [Bacillus velezensis]MDL5024697.1 HNH endonuclease [Bacillus velezensis]MEC3611177.1 HNH endonuclease [Bacillus velezensis]MEC3679858.1 HNH endonuclease [Bacillus velezensis]